MTTLLNFKKQKVMTNKKNNTLSYTIPHEDPAWYNSNKEILYKYVSYKKVSDKTSYDDFKATCGTSLAKPIDYPFKTMPTKLEFTYTFENEKEYEKIYAEMDYINKSAKFYYQELGGEVYKTFNSTFSAELVRNSESTYYFGVKFANNPLFGNKHFTISYMSDELASFMYIMQEEGQAGITTVASDFDVASFGL